MKVNVLLITYNHEKYIEEAIASILMQRTKFDYEIVVADDYSSDRTKEIIENCLNKSTVKNKILESTGNLGIPKNYQRGFENCFAEYIAILEGDDYWTDPYRLQKHIDFLDNHYECVMTFNRVLFYSEKKKEFIISDPSIQVSNKYYGTREMICSAPAFNFSSYTYRNSAIMKLDKGVFNLNIADWMLNICISQYGLICGLGEVMSVYRIHDKGAWSGVTEIGKYLSVIKIIKEYDLFLEHRFKIEFKIIRKKNIKGMFREIIKRIIKFLLFIK